MKMKKAISLTLALVASVAIISGCGSKKSAVDKYPEKPITFIIPFPAGGAGDLMARTLSIPLEKELGKSIVVVNKPGGSGAIGLLETLKAKPDGYTIGQATPGIATIVPQTTNVGYTNKEFKPIAQITDTPGLFAVRKNLPVSTMQEFIEYAKKNPGKVTYATSAAGGIHNVAMEGALIKANLTGVIKHVPFTGGSDAMAAVLGGQVDSTLGTASEIIPYMKNGELKVLGSSSSVRYAQAPDVPTFKESGFPLEYGLWFGVFAGKDVPDEIVKKLEVAFEKAMKDQRTVDTLLKANQPLVYAGTKEFTSKWMNDYESYKSVVEALSKNK